MMISESASPQVGIRANHASPVVIATDGRSQSDAALVVGRLLAGEPDAIRVVTVLKPMPMLSGAQVGATRDLVADRRANVRSQVTTQMTRTGNQAVEVELRDGDPATVVSRLAHGAGAAMIVCGLGRHRVADRMFGDETALRLIRMSDVPVFAAASGAAQAPKRIVVAVDFAETSLRAARLAIEIAAPAATIYLVHVFGVGTAGGRHLTRTIGGVTSIMVLRDEMQRDLAIRIAHGAGLTLLTFTS